MASAEELFRQKLEEFPALRIVQVFRRCDKNGDGLIDREELGQVFKSINAETWTDDRLDKLLKIVDVSGDGKIQFEELVAWLDSGAGSNWKDAITIFNGTEDSDVGELHEMLDCAKYFKWDAVFDILGQHPGYVDMRPDVRCFCVLHQAAYNGNQGVVDKLVNVFGANPEILTKMGETPEAVARGRNYGDVADWLKVASDDYRRGLLDLTIPAVVVESKTLENSNFVFSYTHAKPAKDKDWLYDVVDNIMRCYLEEKGESNSDDAVDAFMDALRKNVEALPLSTVQQLGGALWTSPKQCKGKYTFYGTVQDILRRDIGGDLMRDLAVYSRTLNGHVVSRKASFTHAQSIEKLRQLPWPHDHRLYRGTWLPLEQLKWFKAGQEYRVPMLLATSHNRAIPQNFLNYFPKAPGPPTFFTPVIITVRIDPERLCQQVNFIESITTCKGESEWLFVAYSAFKVLTDPVIPRKATAARPATFEILALPDNKDATSSLPLMSWH